MSTTFDDAGPWSRWADRASLAGTAGQQADVVVTPTDGLSHDAEATVRLLVIEQMGALPGIRVVHASQTNGDPTVTITDTDGVRVGDLLIGYVISTEPNVSTPSGWTRLLHGGGWSIPHTNTSVTLDYKIAGSTDVGGSFAWTGSGGTGATESSVLFLVIRDAAQTATINDWDHSGYTSKANTASVSVTSTVGSMVLGICMLGHTWAPEFNLTAWENTTDSSFGVVAGTSVLPPGTHGYVASRPAPGTASPIHAVLLAIKAA